MFSCRYLFIDFGCRTIFSLDLFRSIYFFCSFIQALSTCLFFLLEGRAGLLYVNQIQSRQEYSCVHHSLCSEDNLHPPSHVRFAAYVYVPVVPSKRDASIEALKAGFKSQQLPAFNSSRLAALGRANRPMMNNRTRFTDLSIVRDQISTLEYSR